MNDRPGLTFDSAPSRRPLDNRFTLPELIFGCLGSLIATGLLVRSAVSLATLTAGILLAAYAIGVVLSESNGRLRLLVNCAAVAVLYGTSGVAIQSLRLPLRQSQLLACDRTLFGETPAVAFQSTAGWWCNELLSVGYLSYHVYLAWVLIDCLTANATDRLFYSRPILTAFGIGFAGYFCFPAADPRTAFPELFDAPVRGGWITQLNQTIVGNLAARYDSFPSVHIFATATIIACDLHRHRLRLAVMAVPSILMVLATILLRLHYATDVLASAILLVPFLLWMQRNQSDRQFA